MSKSSLSAGEVIREILASNEDIAEKVTAIIPVFSNTQELTQPYIVYRRSGMTQIGVKTGRGADTILMQVSVFSSEYAEGVEIAELIRDALDNVPSTHLCTSFDSSFGEAFGGVNDKMVNRSCLLVDCQEAFADDSFIQNLVFEFKI